MLSDQALQCAIAHSIWHRDGPDLAPFLRKGSFDPVRRFNIYRNNTFSSLTATLVAVFPVTLQLLGESYFRHAASLFIRSNPPEEARLVRYGGNFAQFLSRFDDLRGMPFIADTARLEWLIAEALDAPVLPACGLDQLDDGLGETLPELRLQPSLRLMLSRWPALRIWSAHQAGDDLETLAAIGREPERIVLWRNKDSVRFMRLDAAHFAFFQGLKKRVNLESVVARSLSRAPEFDIAGALGALFADGLIASIRHVAPKAN
jgi:hypothetical protein